MLLTGKGINGMAAALASVLCLGAPLSSTLIAGLTALRTERTAGAVGAVIPGWAGVEELNGIDTVRVDAGDLFTIRERPAWKTSASSREAGSTGPSSTPPAS